MGEREYDDIIAPMLMEIVRECEERGMSFVARVQFDDEGNSGITQTMRETADLAQKMAHIAVLSRGNVDVFILEVVKRFDVSGSMFLHSYNRAGEKAATP